MRLSGWTVGYVAANQLSFVATLLVANQLSRGSIAAFDTAYLLFVVPHGLLAASFMTAVMPELARAVQRGDRRGLRREWAQGLRLDRARHDAGGGRACSCWPRRSCRCSSAAPRTSS